MFKNPDYYTSDIGEQILIEGEVFKSFSKISTKV